MSLYHVPNPSCSSRSLKGIHIFILKYILAAIYAQVSFLFVPTIRVYLWLGYGPLFSDLSESYVFGSRLRVFCIAQVSISKILLKRISYITSLSLGSSLFLSRNY